MAGEKQLFKGAFRSSAGKIEPSYFFQSRFGNFVFSAILNIIDYIKMRFKMMDTVDERVIHGGKLQKVELRGIHNNHLLSALIIAQAGGADNQAAGGEKMKVTLNELEKVLYDFVKRAAEKGATPEEIAVLPEVARVLADLVRSY